MKKQQTNYLLLSDDELVALTAYLEARNQQVEGITAVCAVIKNRRDLWKQTCRRVCLADGQFECFKKEAALASEIVKNWEVRLTSDRTLTITYSIARAVLEGTVPSNVGQCTFYERYDRKSPWFTKEVAAGRLREFCRVGDHVFYLETRFEASQGEGKKEKSK